MKVLFHCHTINSQCSNIKEADLVIFLKKNKFDAVIVTDHNIITRINWPDGFVIPASEIATLDGDVIGLFLENNIPRGLSILQTSKLIRSQGGLVVAAHPCDNLRKEAIGSKLLIDNIDCFDIIETYNCRNLAKSANKRALKIATNNKIPTISGSDAHTLGELSNASMEMPAFHSPKEFVNSLKVASHQVSSSGIIPHLKTIMIKRSAQLQKRPQ